MKFKKVIRVGNISGREVASVTRSLLCTPSQGATGLQGILATQDLGCSTGALTQRDEVVVCGMDGVL